MTPVEALERVADLLQRGREPQYKVQAFRRAAREISRIDDAELHFLADNGRLKDLPGVGDKTAAVIAESLRGETPKYLQKLLSHAAEDPGSQAGNALRAALKGDLHAHSDWSDGGHTIRAMAEKAQSLGHEYLALTDHSPRLTVANGLSVERLREQLGVVAQLNEELAPFRILTGVEVDILDDGALDQSEDMLATVDWVVGSVHSKLRMERDAMTRRMVGAIASPHVDALGHCTGRLLTGRGRPQSEFDADVVIAACKHFDTALEVNCRPERLDPPREILRAAVDAGIKLAISTDAHATDQLEWQIYGTDRAAEFGVDAAIVVNAWNADELLEWCASHPTA
ncbi:MAG TPA: PHP domain-containing protein [Acidimicrobiia bacterium]|nr:PHP domain-containing protein [Acidimicrobiia bacterium]